MSNLENFKAKFQNTIEVQLSLTPDNLAQMLILASKQLDEHEQFLNDINVFPVADGDTGSNMSYTLKGVRRVLEKKEYTNFADLGQIIPKNAMLSSRGNSGTLLTQFLKGFCANFSNLEFFNSKSLVEALNSASTA